MQGIHLFTFKGIPVGFQPMFLVLIAILSIGIGSVTESIVFAICAILGVLIHEFGHAFVAKHYGLKPQIVLHGFGGITLHSRSATDKQNFLITFAGPLAGLVTGGVFFGINIVLLLFPPTYAFLNEFGVINLFLTYMFYVNFFWGIFNLIPIIPMDGSKVLNYVIRKFTNQKKAAKISAVIGIVLGVGLLAWSLLSHSMWMIIISAFLLMSNFSAVRAAFQGSEGEKKQLSAASLQAEKAYERGLIAAREHDWKQLEICGNQMKKAAMEPEQIERAYEFLTIAATNQGEYEQALDYSTRARQSDAVKQAKARCNSHLGN